MMYLCITKRPTLMTEDPPVDFTDLDATDETFRIVFFMIDLFPIIL